MALSTVAGVLMTLAIAVGMGLTLAALGIGGIYMRRGAVRRHAVIGGLRAP